VCNNNAYMVIKDSHLEGGEQFGEPACRYCLNQSVHCCLVLMYTLLCALCGWETDYWARICLTTQDKNKYNTPKYRYVVQFVSSVVKSLFRLA
jgi:hypothetical protein